MNLADMRCNMNVMHQNFNDSDIESVESSEVMANDNNKFNVLVVDDAQMIRKLHEAHLEMFGFNVQVVEDGKKAVDLVRSGTCFDLILLDWEMPMMGGIEATKELRAMGVNSMIVGVTSCDSPDDKQVFMEAGLDYCIGKPLEADKINFLLHELNKNKKQ